MAASIANDPRPTHSARIVAAHWEAPDPCRLETLSWLCECGHQGSSQPGESGWCPACMGRIRIPDEPMEASKDLVLAALAKGCANCNKCTPKGFKCLTCESEA